MMQFTEEQRKALIQFAEEVSSDLRMTEDTSDVARNTVEIFKIALAALTANVAGKFVFEPLEGRYHHIKHGEHQHTEPKLPMVRLYTAPPISAPVVPAGWKLVPVEPTPEMISAGKGGCVTSDMAREIYDDMLAAAPEVQQ